MASWLPTIVAAYPTCVCFPGAAVLKYGSLLLELPFHPSPEAALAIILIPTLGVGLYMQNKG
jgi:hypothetical protein